MNNFQLNVLFNGVGGMAGGLKLGLCRPHDENRCSMPPTQLFNLVDPVCTTK